MPPQKFIGTTTTDALKLVRETVGGDAIVISTRDIPAGVEIIAISPTDLKGFSKEPPKTPTARATIAPHQEAPQSKPLADMSTAATTSEMTVLLAQIKTLLQAQLANDAWGEMKEHASDVAEALRLMLHAGFSPEVSGELVDELKRQSPNLNSSVAERLQDLLEERLQVTDALTMFDQGGTFAFIGSTGVGKTTVTAKIAARCVLRFGRDKVGLLTTDTYRIGAQEQVKTYAKIIGVPVVAVRDSADLASRLAAMRDRKVILIDTAGVSQRDLQMLEQLQLLNGGAEDLRHVLVMSSTSNLRTLEEVIGTYQSGLGTTAATRLDAAIVTKTDEAAQLGPIVDCLVRHKLPLMFIANGQRVPEDLSQADAPYLCHRALRRSGPGETVDLGSEDIPWLMIDQLSAWSTSRR